MNQYKMIIVECNSYATYARTFYFHKGFKNIIKYIVKNLDFQGRIDRRNRRGPTIHLDREVLYATMI